MLLGTSVKTDCSRGVNITKMSYFFLLTKNQRLKIMLLKGKLTFRTWQPWLATSSAGSFVLLLL